MFPCGAFVIHGARHATGTAQPSPIIEPIEHVRDASEDRKILFIILGVLIVI